MPQTRVVIGPFRRRAFAEGLAARLRREPWLAVESVADEREIEPYLDASEPVLILLEQRGDNGWRRYLPVSEFVSVILIASEGQGDVQVTLRNVEAARMRAAIGLLAEMPHPKVLSLDGDTPLTVTPVRQGTASGLAWVVAWLDAAFAVALDDFVHARGSTPEAPWMQDLAYLRTHFARGEAVTRDLAERRFDALAEAPMWQLRMFHTFGLAREELKLLCLCAAPDLDQRYGQAVGLLQNNYAEPRPSATTLAMFFSPDHVGADIEAILRGPRPFARLRMVRPAEAGTAPQPGYRVADGLLDLMHGIRRRAGPDWWLQSAGLNPQPALAALLGRILASDTPPLLLGDAADPQAAGELAAAIVATGRDVLRVDCARAGSDPVRRLTDWALAARIHDAVLMLEGLGALGAADQAAVLGADLDGLTRGRIAIGSTALAPAERDALHIRVPKPGTALVAARWQTAVGRHGLEISGDEAMKLAGTLRLPPEDIETIGRMAAGALRIGGASDGAGEVLRAARHLAAHHAPETVRRPTCIFGWDDIVLPPPVKRLVQSIPDHVRLGPTVLESWDFASRLPYGRGVGAMFSGPSGTGKTMCAQVIAGALGVELMQVEIARCVSKYIGETEKNIDRCFAAAEAASAVLLFDEADAMFGKRTEIRDAHDRHANVEVAYLLQRIEAYEGLVILTTNLRTNVDQAFLRRLRFVVDFPMPDAGERSRIWQLAFPGKARCGADVDTAFLARRLPLSGGSIQAIAVNAAFAAAAEGADEIAMQHIMAATRAELIKNGMFSAERELPEPVAAAAGGGAP